MLCCNKELWYLFIKIQYLHMVPLELGRHTPC
jgi:hypothetical protein